MAAMASGAVAALIGIGVDRAGGGHWRVAGVCGAAWPGLDHLSGQSADFGRGAELSGLGHDGAGGAKAVWPRRAHAAAGRGCAVQPDHLALCRGAARRADDRAVLCRGDLWPFDPGLCRAGAGAADMVGACIRTRFGLRLRAVGENPAAVDTAGVSVVGMRFAAVAITGRSVRLAGAYMATALQAGFGREMTAGRGYIALAALIFAKWRPWYALWATLLFGFFQALALRPDVVERVLTVQGAGAGTGRPALYPDRGGSGGVYRQSHAAARRGRALCQRTLRRLPT